MCIGWRKFHLYGYTIESKTTTLEQKKKNEHTQLGYSNERMKKNGFPKRK